MIRKIMNMEYNLALFVPMYLLGVIYLLTDVALYQKLAFIYGTMFLILLICQLVKLIFDVSKWVYHKINNRRMTNER